jgi:hypothetical protein
MYGPPWPQGILACPQHLEPSGLVMHLLWCYLGTHHEGVMTPRFYLWAPVHRPSWTLTSPT